MEIQANRYLVLRVISHCRKRYRCLMWACSYGDENSIELPFLKYLFTIIVWFHCYSWMMCWCVFVAAVSAFVPFGWLWSGKKVVAEALIRIATLGPKWTWPRFPPTELFRCLHTSLTGPRWHLPCSSHLHIQGWNPPFNFWVHLFV